MVTFFEAFSICDATRFKLSEASLSNFQDFKTRLLENWTFVVEKNCDLTTHTILKKTIVYE